MHDDPALFLDGPGEVSRIRGYVRKVPTLFRPFCGTAANQFSLFLLTSTFVVKVPHGLYFRASFANTR